MASKKSIPTVKQELTDLDVKVDNQINVEFGGPIGVTLMMLGFPSLMYYFWVCLEYHQGHLILPDDSNLSTWFTNEVMEKIKLGASPSWYAFKVYMGYVAFSFVLAYIMPGPIVEGLPVPSLKGNKVIHANYKRFCTQLSIVKVSL